MESFDGPFAGILAVTTLNNLAELAHLVCEHNKHDFKGPQYTTNDAARDKDLDDGIYAKYLAISTTAKVVDPFKEATGWEVHLVRKDENGYVHRVPRIRRKGASFAQVIRMARRVSYSPTQKSKNPTQKRRYMYWHSRRHF